MDIIFTSTEHIESYWSALDQVARENKYLLFTKAPDIQQTKNFVNSVIDHSWTQYLALSDNQVVGWCDIVYNQLDAQKHIGHLGMGVISKYRGLGYGNALIKKALDDAFSKGITRVELGVFSSNERAINLYKKHGFSEEGRKHKAWYYNGIYEDIIVMGLLK